MTQESASRQHVQGFVSSPEICVTPVPKGRLLGTEPSSQLPSSGHMYFSGGQRGFLGETCREYTGSEKLRTNQCLPTRLNLALAEHWFAD